NDFWNLVPPDAFRSATCASGSFLVLTTSYTCTVPHTNHLECHVAASDWPAAMTWHATWHPRGKPMTGQRRSTTAGPSVNGVSQRNDRRSTTVNYGGPPLTTAGPPVNHQSTVADHR
ncbi:hypothetical protein Tco_0845144, partial [Tanacetum coccineum]